MIRKSLLKEFREKVGSENVFTDKADLFTYAYDAAVLDPVLPAAALRPVTSEALSYVVRLCNENRIPLTVRGAGTNLSGGTIPFPDGVVVLTNALNRILEINEA
ncbi:MAG: FAD-binding protein, partial [Nitrospinaceae bacterium]|nr:FAD-binding protein [Nitrospinaceae bacterium]